MRVRSRRKVAGHRKIGMQIGVEMIVRLGWRWFLLGKEQLRLFGGEVDDTEPGFIDRPSVVINFGAGFPGYGGLTMIRPASLLGKEGHLACRRHDICLAYPPFLRLSGTSSREIGTSTRPDLL